MLSHKTHSVQRTSSYDPVNPSWRNAVQEHPADENMRSPTRDIFFCFPMEVTVGQWSDAGGSECYWVIHRVILVFRRRSNFRDETMMKTLPHLLLSFLETRFRFSFGVCSGLLAIWHSEAHEVFGFLPNDGGYNFADPDVWKSRNYKAAAIFFFLP